MDLTEYQHQAEMTSGAYGAGMDRKVLASLALAGEVGEFCNLLKKYAAHGHDIPDATFLEELGDILWHLAELATAWEADLSEVGKNNLAKLKARYPDGFSKERSRERDEY